jgi:uncharacterized protein involved in exopolysaccharide biosynthesis
VKRPFGWLTLGILVAVVGCQRDADSMRAQLAQEQGTWARELDALRARQDVLEQRFRSQPTAVPSVPGGVSAPHVRVRAILDGSRQSLADVDLQIRQAGSRLEPALSRGGEAADKAIADERERIAGLLRRLSEQLVTVSGELDDVGKRGETKRAEE